MSRACRVSAVTHDAHLFGFLLWWERTVPLVSGEPMTLHPQVLCAARLAQVAESKKPTFEANLGGLRGTPKKIAATIESLIRPEHHAKGSGGLNTGLNQMTTIGREGSRLRRL
jgi:hypothetical protein